MNLSEIRWNPVLRAAAVSILITFVAIFLIVTAYASLLAIQARGAPDTDQIAVFGDQVGTWGGVIIGFIVTALAGRWAARKAGSQALMHGLMVGVVVAGVGLVSSLVLGGGVDLLSFVVSISGGLVGGVLAGPS
jgi:fructose-specific phosphotransferase system IIC component